MDNKIKKIIILLIILLPFSLLLDVKAEGVTITTDANNKITDVEDENGVRGGSITVTAVNAEYDANYEDSDQFEAYKILDAYYDDDTNKVSYQFTTDFQSFLNDSSYANDPTVHGLTVNQYLALTSDNTDECVESETIGNNNYCTRYGGKTYNTTSTLNILVSKYTEFIRKRYLTNPLQSLYMYNSTIPSGTLEGAVQSRVTGAEVTPGSYLIIPRSVYFYNNYYSGFVTKLLRSYGVMVANVQLVGVDGEWQLSNAAILAKLSGGKRVTALLIPTTSAAINEGLSEEETTFVSGLVGTTLAINRGGTVIVGAINVYDDRFPINAHSSIVNNQIIMQGLKAIRIELPNGFTFNYDGAYYGDNSITATKTGDSYYDEDNNLLMMTNGNRSVDIYNGITTIDIVASDDYNFTAGEYNRATAAAFAIKDPYVDIGSNVTLETIQLAFESGNTENDTDQYAAIRQAFAIRVYNLDLVLYGLKINNTDGNGNNLANGEFQVYSDSNCTTGNEIGDPITISNGTGSIVGVTDYSPFCIKQTDAPYGYKLLDPIVVDPTELILDQDGYYTVNAVNERTLALPFTGGSGTIIYIIIGLVLIVVSIIFIIIYKKKNRPEEKLKNLYRN